jgi:hypothetical protein
VPLSEHYIIYQESFESSELTKPSNNFSQVERCCQNLVDPLSVINSLLAIDPELNPGTLIGEVGENCEPTSEDDDW